MGRLREIEFLYLIFVSNHRNIKSAISNENLLNPDIKTKKLFIFNILFTICAKKFDKNTRKVEIEVIER